MPAKDTSTCRTIPVTTRYNRKWFQNGFQEMLEDLHKSRADVIKEAVMRYYYNWLRKKNAEKKIKIRPKTKKLKRIKSVDHFPTPSGQATIDDIKKSLEI